MTAPVRSFLVLAVALAGCASGPKIQTQFDPNAPYPTYKTYAWFATEPGAEQAAAIRDPNVRKLIVGALDREMSRKGLTRVTPDENPSFYVTVIGWGQQRVEVTPYGYGYGGAYMYGGYGGGYVVPSASVQQYTDGTLVLDFVDAQSKKLVWRGTANDTISNPAAIGQVIDDVAQKLLAAYPPRTK